MATCRLMQMLALFLIIFFVHGTHSNLISAQSEKIEPVFEIQAENSLNPIISTLDWYPEESKLLLQSKGNTLALYDITTHEVALELESFGSSRVAEFSSNGNRLATLSDWLLQVWNVESEDVIINIDLGSIDLGTSHYGIASDLAWILDDQTIALIHDYNLSFVNMENSQIHTLSRDEIGGYIPLALDWHSQSQLAIDAISEDGGTSAIIIFDPAQLSIIKIIRLSDAFNALPYPYSEQALEWHPAGNLLAAIRGNSNYVVTIWDVQDETIYMTLPESQTKITAIAWNPTGTLLAVAYGGDKTQTEDAHLIQLWNLESNSVSLTLDGFSNEITAISWDSTGNFLAGADADGKVLVWNVRDS